MTTLQKLEDAEYNARAAFNHLVRSSDPDGNLSGRLAEAKKALRAAQSVYRQALLAKADLYKVVQTLEAAVKAER